MSDLSPASRRPSVVVLTYNSAATIEACLTSVLDQVEPLDGQVIVVDNASDDETVHIAAQHPVVTIQTGANLGFAGGCNVGARHATGDLVVLLNPDAVLDPGALGALVEATSSADRLGPIGGRAHHEDGSYDFRAAQGVPSLWGAICFGLALDKLGRGSRRFDPEHGPAHLPADGSVHPVPAVSGALMAVPIELWRSLNGFDESYFLYGEDVDLSIRASRLGWEPVVVGNAGYHHIGAVSSGGSPVRDVLLYRGKVELYRRHLGPVSARLAITALQFGVLVRGLPFRSGVPRLVRQASPWWSLFVSRRDWRQGYRDHRPLKSPV